MVAGGLSAIGFWFITDWLMSSVVATNPELSTWHLWAAGLIGLALTAAMVVITEYYTAAEFKPVRHVAEASTTGHATNIIAGLGVSMKSTAWPVISVCIAILASYWLAGLCDCDRRDRDASMTGIIVALDAYGPITDNAGGIPKMADLPASVARDHRSARRSATRPRRSPRAMRSARRVLPRWSCSPTTRTLSGQYQRELRPVRSHGDRRTVPRRLDPVSVRRDGDGSRRACGRRRRRRMRRQFKEIPGIMAGTAKPDTASRSTC